MKIKLLFLCLVMAGISHAQIVIIPDPQFKEYLINYQFGVIDANQDGEIQVSEAAAIENLEIIEFFGLYTITDIEGINAFTNLTSLTISTSATNINLSGFPQLTYLSLQGEEVDVLNITGLGNVQAMYLTSLNVESLDLSSMESLQLAHIYALNNLTTLTIGNNLNLNTFDINSSSLAYLDLSTCANLTEISIVLNNEDKDVFVNIKNGNPISTVNDVAIQLISLNPTIHKCHLCVDEGEAVYQLSPGILISSYCTLSPGGNYNTIAGMVMLNGDDNGCGVNSSLSHFKMQVSDNINSSFAFTNADGDYNFYTEAGFFTITPEFENTWFTASPSSLTVPFPDDNSNVLTQNFCITPNGVHPDLEIVLVPVIAAQPGFDAAYQIVYKNKGNQSLSGDVSFTYDNAVLDYVSAAPVETTASAGSLVWAYTNLQPFETRTIDLVLNLNGPMEIPAVEIGHELLFDVAITPLSGDETPQDNNFGLKQTVVGSFDPNDITCLQGAYVSPDKIGEYLHYNINFENTGTAPATFIVVKDVIDEAQFDVGSLQLLNASHDVQVRLEGNKVEFFFDNIDLGAQEKGNVVFKIKTLNTLQANDDVTQQANIFFDYNWPIETNETTTVFQVLGTNNFDMDDSVSIYPNPAISLINIKASSAINSIQLYDMQGRLLQALSTNDMDAVIDISNRASGMYVLKITTETGVKAEKIVKK